jgi:hypothetical protein
MMITMGIIFDDIGQYFGEGRVVVVKLWLLGCHPWQMILGGDGMMITMGIIFDDVG